jgi:hypothetical protein
MGAEAQESIWESLYESDGMSEKCGSKEWLKSKAWFTCEHCEYDDVTSVHRPADLKMWNGKTICDDCWSGIDDDSFPPTWNGLDPFEPFACLDVEVTE